MDGGVLIVPYCPQCNAHCPERSRFCDQCGGTLDAGQPAPPQPTPPAGPPPGARRVTIGREPGNDVLIPSHQDQVSRKHAVVHVAGSELFIEDLSTTNGVYVNGRPAVSASPFRMSDEVRFGTFVFDTERLRPFVTTPAVQQPVAPQPPASGRPVVQVRHTFFDQAFNDESSWLPRFMMVAGIALLALFLIPVAANGSVVVTSFDLLSEPGVNGAIKLTIALLPITGITLLILRAMKASRTVVGLVLLGAAVPIILGSGLSVDDLPMDSSDTSALAWRMGLGWLMFMGSATAMMVYSTRPRDKVVRTLLAVCPTVFLLLHLLPVQTPLGSVIPLFASIEELGDLPAFAVMAVASNVMAIALSMGGLWFLTPEKTPGERKVPAQVLAAAICLLPAVAIFFIVITLVNEAAALLTALWFSVFVACYCALPMLGGSLLLLNLRKES